MDALLRQISEQNPPPALARIVSDIWLLPFLQANVLERIHRILVEKDLHWVSIVSYDEIPGEADTIISLSSFEFSEQTRLQNTGIHIDSIDIPLTRHMVLTALYSPLWSHSSIPTVTFDAKLVDEKAKVFLESRRDSIITPYQAEFDGIKQKVLSILGSEGWEKQPSFYTTLLNTFLAHREINAQTNNKLRVLRDEFTRSIISEYPHHLWVFAPTEDTSSLLIFRNWLGEDRGVVHARFSIEWEEATSHGTVYNLGIWKWWQIATKNKPQVIPEGIVCQDMTRKV